MNNHKDRKYDLKQKGNFDVGGTTRHGIGGYYYAQALKKYKKNEIHCRDQLCVYLA